MEMLLPNPQRVNRLTTVDARVKIAAAAALLVMVLSYQGIVFPLIIIALFTVNCIFFRIPPRMILFRFVEPLFIVAMIIMLRLLFTGDTPLFTIKLAGISITGHVDGLVDGVHIAARVLGAVSIVALFGFTTPFTDMLSGMAWFRIPRGFIEILMLAYRYIFLILEEALVIYHAQKNRLGYATLRRGLDSFGILAGTLILKAFDKSQVTTAAMIRRGYNGALPVQLHLPFKKREVAGGCLIVILLGIVWKL